MSAFVAISAALGEFSLDQAVSVSCVVAAVSMDFIHDSERVERLFVAACLGGAVKMYESACRYYRQVLSTNFLSYGPLPSRLFVQAMMCAAWTAWMAEPVTAAARNAVVKLSFIALCNLC